jgi:hypothetical protein
MCRHTIAMASELKFLASRSKDSVHQFPGRFIELK